MKITALSDIHGTLLPVEDYFEPCEMVVICGDIVPLSIQANSRKTRAWLKNQFRPWCESLPCDKVLFIAGNHDLHFNLDFMYREFPKDKKVTYLFHENYVYTSRSGKEYSVFGTPYCKQFGTWAYMEDDETLVKLFDQIPEGLDILLTHDNPYMFGDIILQYTPWNKGEHLGSKPLMEAILLKQPKYQFNGHLHSSDHNLIEIGSTKHYNVSIKDEAYDPVYDPLTLEI